MLDYKHNFVILYTLGMLSTPHTQTVSSSESESEVKAQFAERLSNLCSDGKILAVYQNISVCDAVRKCEKELNLVKQLSCTVCGGELLHNRVEDSRATSRVFGSGAIVDLGIKTNGYDEFVCANNSEHMLSEEMYEMLTEHIDSYAHIKPS